MTSEQPLRELLITTKDGDWGVEYPKEGFVPYRVIRGSDFPDVRSGNITTTPLRYLNENTVVRRTLQHRDILIETAGGNRDRPTGRTLFINYKLLCKYDHPVTCASFSRFLRIDPSKAEPEYVFWYLQYLYAIGIMWEHQVQHTGVARFQYIKFAESIKIPLPLLSEQRAIAGILGSLDDKIEVNRRMNTILESMAWALFHQWFVENDEVGKWEAKKFSDISDLSRGAITPNQFPDETFNHYSIPAYDEKQFPKKELGIEIMSNKFLVPDDCVLISKLNPETRRIWIPFQIEGRSICSTEFLVNIPKGYFSLEYIYGLFSSQSFQGRYTSMVTGTSGSHQRVKPEYLLDMDIQIPPKKLVMEYTESVKPLFQKVQQNILESRTLGSLRDGLLPKLMRGEVRVK